MTTTHQDHYPLLAIRSEVPLPGVIAPIEVGRLKSVKAVEAASKDERYLVVVPQRDPQTPDPEPDELFDVGVLAEITQLIEHGPRRYTAVLNFDRRVTIDEITATDPYMVAQVTDLESEVADEAELASLVSRARSSLAAIVADEEGDADVSADVLAITDPDELADFAATRVTLERAESLQLLAEPDPAERLGLLLPQLERLSQVLEMKADIGAEMDDQTQRERILRERMKSIKEELGEEDDADLDELRERVASSKMSEEAMAAAKRELGRMGHMNTSSPEYNVARTYVETLLDIPWGEYTEDTLDIAAARAVLDAGHAGLDKVKKRILEFIAVKKLAPDKHGPILCLVGPPGVGKTSLGRAIAEALAREYVRAALGGVRDESEIRGHRRTYIGALPGRIVSSLKKAGSMNPVFILDEVDKLGSSFRGDPSSALLEVLDPEQNHDFNDHYVAVPVDLSRVMFIATANQLDTIPPALLDRMEVIEIPGYTAEEKRAIAREHLVPKQIAEHGLDKDQLSFGDDVLDEIIGHYTREAGVRNLEREIGAVCRAAAVKIAGGAEKVDVNVDNLADILGPRRHEREMVGKHDEPGIATGLAWTPVGGEILFIEARRMPGKGELKLTGQLGDIMSESAMAAQSWVRANGKRYDIAPELFSESDIHMHIPSGAVRKDGPSAGIALATGLVSLLTGKKVRADLGMTGELTLRGRVLPVGGIKEKVLAAHRAGITTVLLPERNEKDVVEIPEHVRDELDIRYVSHVTEVIDIALAEPETDKPPATPPTPPPPTGKSPASDDAGDVYGSA